MIAGRYGAHFFANRGDNPRTFVTENGGQRSGEDAITNRKIGVTHARSNNAHQHFARARWFQIKFGKLELAMRFAQERRRYLLSLTVSAHMG